MKLDHFVVNIDAKYQKNKDVIEQIRSKKLPYEPSWGKGTRGFKVSDLWIGNEYLEMVHILKKDGGGWVREWTEKYLQGHRGMICLMLDVENIDELYDMLSQKGLAVTKPQWLEFKWFFNLLTRRMPWRNCYVPFFEGVSFQIGFQEMKDDEARDFMNQYMVPNSREKGIDGIYRVVIKGQFTDADFEWIHKIFEQKACQENDAIRVVLSTEQFIEFVKSATYEIDMFTNVDTGNVVEIENIKVHC